MTLQALGFGLLGAILLVCVGLLLGAAWTTQALRPRLGQQAEERRRLNEEWATVRAAQHQLAICPRCGYQLTDQEWYFERTPVERPPDDD